MSCQITDYCECLEPGDFIRFPFDWESRCVRCRRLEPPQWLRTMRFEALLRMEVRQLSPAGG